MKRDRDLQQLAERLGRVVPEQLKAARDDFDTNLRPLVDAGLDRLDLVTREEFEVQKAVLARTREKVERLEALLAELEAQRDPGR